MAEIDLDKEIQKIGLAAYSFKLDNDDVEVGDKAAIDFKPCLKLNRWVTECYLKIWLPTTKKVKEKVEKNKIKWLTQDLELCFYPLKVDKQNQCGGVEFEIVLKKKPAENIITLNIETQGLKFYYQPPLTEEEWPEGYVVTETEARDENGSLDAYRPENVVGSYAVYHATKTPFHKSKEEAEKYKCGKAFHLYRPRLTDADGNQTWADLDLDDVEGTLTIIVDQNWLDNAVYPVRVDPDFGYEGTGGTSRDISYYMYACLFPISEDGLAQSISWYVTELSSENQENFEVAIYDSDKALLAVGGPDTIPADYDDWFTVTLASNPELTNAASYWLSGWETGAGTGDVNCFYDAVGGWDYGYTTGDRETWPHDPLAGTFTTGRKFFVYCTYEEVSAAQPTIFFSHNF